MPKDTKPTARQVTQRKERKERIAEQTQALSENDYATMGFPGMREREAMDKAASQGRLMRPATAAMNRVLAMKALESAKVRDVKTAVIEQKALDARIDKDLAARMESAIPTGSIPVQNPGRNPFMTGTRRRKKGGRKGRKTRRRA